MQPTLEDTSFPNILQTAYQKCISCEEAIFVTQKAILKLLKENGSAFLCVNDLEKAFDTIEVPVLLHTLYHAGVNAWKDLAACEKLVLHWYCNRKASIRVVNTLSPHFQPERGIQQGSVLSPAFFLLVVDQMLQGLQQSNCGVNVTNLYIGAATNADDVRTVAHLLKTTQEQATPSSTSHAVKGSRSMLKNARWSKLVAMQVYTCISIMEFPVTRVCDEREISFVSFLSYNAGLLDYTRASFIWG